MSGIFISYRREDSQELAGRLFDRLAQRFGKDRVFRDIDAIEPGAKFAEVIAERIGGCDALVALIGKGWLDAKDAQGRRRLDLPNDFVKAEIAEALAQSKLVIPVLIEGTPMPARDALPPEIAALADHNALPVSDSRFDFDVGRLVSAIDKVLPPRIGDRIAGPLGAHPGLATAGGLPGLRVGLRGDLVAVGPHRQAAGYRAPCRANHRETAAEGSPGKFNIAVAHLEGDDKRETERLILESLAEFPSVVTLSFDRLVASEQGDREKAEREGHERARTLLLKASGADVLIWGVVLKQGGKSLPKLYWTPARDVAWTPSAGRYQMTEALSLPSIFWQDLTNVLGLLVATSDAEFAAQPGGNTQRTSSRRSSSACAGYSKAAKQSNGTPPRVRKSWSFLAARSRTYGEQSGHNEPL